MIFISLNKLRRKPTKELIAEFDRIRERATKDGVKFLSSYWTLGRYDTIHIFEAPNEKTAMKVMIRFGEILSTETLAAVPREDAIKLVE